MARDTENQLHIYFVKIYCVVDVEFSCRTGTIDLDLIQTGISTSARKQREMIIEAIKEILEDLPASSSSTTTVDRITAKLRERVSATQRNEVLDALRLMADEQYLELVGKETSVRKL